MLQIKGLLAVYVYDIMRKIPLLFVSPLVLYPEYSCTCSYILIPGLLTPLNKMVAVHSIYTVYFLTHWPWGNFAEKCVLKLVVQVFWSLSCYKELKHAIKPFTDRTLCSFLIQMQNISLRSSGMCSKQNCDMVFVFTSDTAVLNFTFCFSCLIFFLLLGI